MSKVRFAIIGCGMIANFHAAAIAQIPEAELTGAFDEHRPSAQRFLETWPVKLFSSLDELCASEEVDAVCVCTPSGLHTAQAVKVMEAG